MRKIDRQSALMWLAFFLLLSPPAFALEVVVPNIYTDTPTPNVNSLPWGNGCDDSRFQQVYDDAQIPDGIIITGMAYRTGASEDYSFPSSLYENVSITLSSTTKDSTNLSSTFANNVGSNPTIVFSGDLTLSSAFSNASPRPFDIEIPFSSSFFYSGSNLLVDIVIETCEEPVTFMDRAGPGDNVRRVWADDRTAPTGVVGPRGIITQFQYESSAVTSVPAISTWGTVLLIVLFMFGFVVVQRRWVGR